MSTALLDRDLFTGAVRSMPADALSSLRSIGAEKFVSQGFPTTRDENWKYTKLTRAAEISNGWLREIAVSGVAAVAQAADRSVVEDITARIDAHWIVIRGGLVDTPSLERTRDALGSDIQLTRLTDQRGQFTINTDDPMSAFNAALLQDGLLIEIGNDGRLIKPIGILHLDSTLAAVSQARVVIDLQPSSCLNVIELALSPLEGPRFSNSVVEATVGEGATLNFARLQLQDRQHVGVTRMIVNLDREAKFNHSAFDLGGSVIRNDVVANIAGEHAAVCLHGMYLADADQHIDNHTRIEHRVGPSTSVEEYRGVLNGRSRCVFNGQAVVFEGADGSDASQSNHNLLLSDKAEIDTKPELEIYADDVKCSHGATVGQLDEAALFYLRSRGLDRDEAGQLLTQAFAASVLKKLAVDECREYISTAVDQKLAGLLQDDGNE